VTTNPRQPATECSHLDADELRATLDELDAQLRGLRLSSLCQECASVASRRQHTGQHCRWCGKPLVGREGEERLPYAELRERLITITRRDAASTTQLAQIRAILTGLLVDVGIETTDDVVRLAVQVRALVRALDADRAAIVELLLATGVEPASGDPVQLAAQVAEWVRHAHGALVEILEEATGDFDRDTIITAAEGALKGVEDE